MSSGSHPWKLVRDLWLSQIARGLPVANQRSEANSGVVINLSSPQHSQGRQTEPPHAPSRGNADYPWDDFDSTSYFQHNYGTLRADDLQILEASRDFFFKTERTLRTGRGTVDGRPARG